MATVFPKIYDIIEQNPHKDLTLRWRETISTEGQTKWDTFSLRPLDPPGLLSLLLLWTDPMYELGTESLRKQILRESILHLHDRIDKELIGRRYPRKKIHDLLANQLSTQAPTSSDILSNALSELFQSQLVHIDRRNKKISFSPEDPRLWHVDHKVYATEEENRWSLIPTGSICLSTWLEEKEKEGWAISWPTADGKYEELKLNAIQQNILSEVSGKIKKEDLAKRMGRYSALKQLGEVHFST